MYGGCNLSAFIFGCLTEEVGYNIGKYAMHNFPNIETQTGVVLSI
ncbi:hypothetical protein JCM19232_1889 [Vibrio ishigakensis]|uniref:Uncharacterized protein n=1 Tax=Vibrio ishigakensis TaxID=1481914 RepID=A0A0B8PDL8_9VIBR|nr:hypothetical protein JCM19232_1889 [Vibrio ishigakensis]